MAINKATSGGIYGRSTAATMTAEAMTSSAGNIYQITATAKQTICPECAYSLNATARGYLDTTWMDAGWDLFAGRVKLTTATSPTVTGSYVTLTSIADIISWNININIATEETTAIGDTWKEQTVVTKGATLTINRFYSTSDFWPWVSSSKTVTFKIWEDGTSGFWCNGIVTSQQPSFAVGQVDKEAITVAITGTVSRF